MFAKSKFISRVAPAMIGVAIAGAAYAATSGEEKATGCEIRTTQQGSMISLDGVFVADAAVSGSYKLLITSVGGGGNTNIRQGGGFSAQAGEEVTLGRVMVGGYGASYDASLEVEAGGETLKCSERIGGSI
ncbi:curli-like amyloid fiber formation chaperone CsgH [Mesorhizobium sp. Z1-4]|uniref:curli-like amyloid fiber formation chaperone CsgH n=1 Tax=Mesorhizobium sp. Z1-4 TaxID=2448478 RepID=UPI000FDCA713|nr:curli-like amyloid fiber formation chaperone CsgH [Mesorhizobium sp. Z1-4]